ncbi:MAG: RdgB/HAM1 family non-canonical purine NTP pyrophosphatase [Crocinitomicaceae bacterium]|nr:RdgB/HAM1 family non-canonical purine NTP pyrophosphatase [Crocinitomicaceae bacterium]
MGFKVSRMMDLVFASRNKNKIIELQEIFGGIIKVRSLSEIGFDKDIVESASTIAGNSLLKAKCIYDKFKYNSISDDTGLEVEMLNGEPGVYSARYAGVNANSNENIKKLLNNLSGKKNRKACFKTVITLIIDGNVHQFEGLVDGMITSQTRGSNGFGYDSVFVPLGHEKTFAEMQSFEKNKISHRFLALKKTSDFISGIV